MVQVSRGRHLAPTDAKMCCKGVLGRGGRQCNAMQCRGCPTTSATLQRRAGRQRQAGRVQLKPFLLCCVVFVDWPFARSVLRKLAVFGCPENKDEVVGWLCACGRDLSHSAKHSAAQHSTAQHSGCAPSLAHQLLPTPGPARDDSELRGREGYRLVSYGMVTWRRLLGAGLLAVLRSLVTSE